MVEAAGIYLRVGADTSRVLRSVTLDGAVGRNGPDNLAFLISSCDTPGRGALPAPTKKCVGGPGDVPPPPPTHGCDPRSADGRDVRDERVVVQQLAETLDEHVGTDPFGRIVLADGGDGQRQDAAEVHIQDVVPFTARQS